MENKQEKPRTKKGLWTAEEDLILKTYVKTHGEGHWAALSKKSGLKRGGKSCRLRWMNYLRPNIKRGGMSEEEEDLIIRMHKLLGNRWALIAGRLPGRTDNEVKNYWNTHLNKKLSSSERRNSNKGNEKKEEKSWERRGEEGERKKEENGWIENAQRMNYYVDSPLEMGLINHSFWLEDYPTLASLDSFALLESLGWYGL